MKYFLLLASLLFFLLLTGCEEQQHRTHTHVKHNERYYQTRLCKELDGIMEKRLPDRTRIDCLTNTYAIEVDFAKKWAESVGQSLYYAQMTGKKPAVGLIVDGSQKDLRHLKRLKLLARKYRIKIFKLKK